MLSLKKANVPAATNTSKPNRTSGRRVKANVSSPLSRNCPPNPGFVRLLKTRSELDDRGVSQMTRMVDSFRAGLKFKFAPTHRRVLLARNLYGAPFCGCRRETRSRGDTPRLHAVQALSRVSPQVTRAPNQEIDATEGATARLPADQLIERPPTISRYKSA